MTARIIAVLFSLVLLTGTCGTVVFATGEDTVVADTAVAAPSDVDVTTGESATIDGEQQIQLHEKVQVMDRSGGIFGFLNTWFGSALKWLYQISGDYLLAILIFALLVKVILFPLSVKQQKNSQKMAKLAPKQEAIRKKYAGRNDRATQMKMQEEMQQLYADEKFNPMGGCLPMLIQLPIILALYQSITNPLSSVLGYGKEKLELLTQFFTNNQHLFDKIAKSITETDAISYISKAGENSEKVRLALDEVAPGLFSEITNFYSEFNLFGIGGFNMMDKPEIVSLLVIVPVLVFLSSFFSTKLIRKLSYNPNGAQMDASMKIMDWTMPLMILWFSFQVPAVVGIYWIFQNVISIVQQFALYKLFPVKAPTPEEIREAELLMRGKKKAERSERSEKEHKPEQPRTSAPRKKKANSPFIYAKKGIDPKYLERVKAKGVVPKAKMKP